MTSKGIKNKNLNDNVSLSPIKKQAISNQLEKLREYTTVVADSGDIESIGKYKPKDATTNPSLLYKAAQMPMYEHLVLDAIDYGRKLKNIQSENERLHYIIDKLSVNFGIEILKIVPGYISTEVDARLSFDTKGTIHRAHRIIDLYKKAGISKDRILIKIASTYEGIEACKLLEKEGISCNMTLLFSLVQAIHCAEANATLISPFVGRILDYYKKKTGILEYKSNEDPGVLSVKEIYYYYKKYNYKTIIMGASFRNKEEILELAGCDKLTVSPTLLEELCKEINKPVIKKLNSKDADEKCNKNKVIYDEKTFRYQLNQDAMATEKLAEGIRGFCEDIEKLEEIIKKKMT